jgi:hypothetical protein
MVESWEGTLSAHIHLEAAWRASATARRVWTGQMARVLPFIEGERWRLAEWFDQLIRRSGGPLATWPGNIASLDIGDLTRCVFDHTRQRELTLPDGRWQLLLDLRGARNKLAHGETISPYSASDLRRRAWADRRR